MSSINEEQLSHTTSLLRVGLIGNPVAHSYSPRFQQAAFDALGIPARYELWQTLAQGEQTTREVLASCRPTPPEQFLILIECRDEKQQVELLGRLQAEGVACKALIS